MNNSRKTPQLSFGDMVLWYHKEIRPLIAFFHCQVSQTPEKRAPLEIQLCFTIIKNQSNTFFNSLLIVSAVSGFFSQILVHP
jgi:hypothetical protein